MIDECVALCIAGEELLLHPQRAVLWPERATVIVADTHFGKSALFGHYGVAVPGGSDDHDRERLSRLIRERQARRLIILGDFLHAPLGPQSRDARDLEAWSATLCGTEIRVIAGNHDRRAAPHWLPSVHWQEEDLIEPPFRFTHDADSGAGGGEHYTLSGHIHPVVRLKGLRKQAPRVPIFWQRRRGLVLPSFGIFTGGYAVVPAVEDRLFAVGSQRVVRLR